MYVVSVSLLRRDRILLLQTGWANDLWHSLWETRTHLCMLGSQLLGEVMGMGLGSRKGELFAGSVGLPWGAMSIH